MRPTFSRLACDILFLSPAIDDDTSNEGRIVVSHSTFGSYLSPPGSILRLHPPQTMAILWIKWKERQQKKSLSRQCRLERQAQWLSSLNPLVQEDPSTIPQRSKVCRAKPLPTNRIYEPTLKPTPTQNLLSADIAGKHSHSNPISTNTKKPPVITKRQTITVHKYGINPQLKCSGKNDIISNLGFPRLVKNHQTVLKLADILNRKWQMFNSVCTSRWRSKKSN